MHSQFSFAAHIGGTLALNNRENGKRVEAAAFLISREEWRGVLARNFTILVLSVP